MPRNQHGAIAEQTFNAALCPGVVLGQPEDGLINFVSDLRDIQRGEVAGYNSRVEGGYRQLFPRLSKVAYELARTADLPEVPGVLEDVLATSGRHLTAVQRTAYLATRKLVEQPTPDGGSRWIIVPKVPQAKNELAILEGEALGGVTELGVGPVSDEELSERKKSRKYTLSQIFSDLDVLQKYQLPLRAVETAKRVAATDPGTAAAMFQDLMNRAQSDVNVTVEAGEYSRNRGQAKNAIAQMCKSVPREDVAVSSLLSINKVFFFGPGGEGDWFVSGPLKYASEVAQVYWLVRHEGPIFPSFLLGMELVLLGIDICDGDTCAEPELRYHASDGLDSPLPSVGIPTATRSLMSTTDLLEFNNVSERLLPVIGASGNQLATAVRVTGRYVLLNSHVVAADPQCTVNGEQVQVRSQLSRDLWSAKCDGDASPWPLRDPEVGEVVVVCCIRNGQLCVSEPLRVTSVDNSCVVTTLDASVGYGASGGALVALQDFALLGVHSAATQANLLSYKFGEKEFSDLLEFDSTSTFSRHEDEGSFAARVVDHFKRKGLARVFDAAVRSVLPVFTDGVHCGMLASNGQHAYTACDPDLHIRVGSERKVLTYSTTGVPGLYKTEAQPSQSTPVFRRPPSFGEKAFVVGFDDSPYISNETRVIHVGPDSKTFILANIAGVDKPLMGGLVMAWDGAVLGVCGPRLQHTTVGLGYVCWHMDREEVQVKAEPRRLLAAAFPFLNLSAWSDALLEEAFTHSSVGTYKRGGPFNAGNKPLANIGDNIAKAELYATLREYTVPHSQWASHMQTQQSNARFAAVAWEHGYAVGLMVGPGVSLQKEAKPYADLTEAVIGAASRVETTEVVRELCRAMGIVFRLSSPLTDSD